MAYKIIISPRAQKEIEHAIDYYVLYSAYAPKHFIEAIQRAYDILAENPYTRIRYKNIRALKIKRFPYALYFILNEEKNTVRVLSCFHSKRNPNKKPGYE